MTDAINPTEEKYFDVDEKDVERLLTAVKGLGFRVRLWFNPPPVRGGKGPQPTPTQCRLVYEPKEKAYADYVRYELEKARSERRPAGKVAADSVASPGTKPGK